LLQASTLVASLSLLQQWNNIVPSTFALLDEPIDFASFVLQAPKWIFKDKNWSYHYFENLQIIGILASHGS
jgi:hypothetical protein